MFSQTLLGVLLGTLLIIGIIPNAVSYKKYGRTCQDIGCGSNEICVMAEDFCMRYSDNNCGRYPTCQKTSERCKSMVCPENQYCKVDNDVPKCVPQFVAGVNQATHRTTPRVSSPLPRVPLYRGRYSGHSDSRDNVNDGSNLSYRTTPRVPSPPPRSSSFGGRYSGHSGSRNSIGDSSIFDRLFGDHHPQPSISTISSTTSANRNNYYQSHTRVDSHGNRVWTFSG